MQLSRKIDIYEIQIYQTYCGSEQIYKKLSYEYIERHRPIKLSTTIKLQT